MYKAEGKKAAIYDTGHGVTETGNQCLRNGTMSTEELEGLTSSGCFYIIIICYSGHWGDYCFNKGIGDSNCLASCLHFNTTIDIDAKRGELTWCNTD